MDLKREGKDKRELALENQELNLKKKITMNTHSNFKYKIRNQGISLIINYEFYP